MKFLVVLIFVAIAGFTGYVLGAVFGVFGIFLSALAGWALGMMLGMVIEDME